MLEPVSLHQNRFNAPGIACDARGIALGTQGGALFGTIDALVGWFRVLSDEIPLDDLLPALTIHEVRSSLQSLAFLVVFHAESSYLLDRASRVASLLGGIAFTGSGKHLVKYRDTRSPLGYDIDAISQEPGDFVLYADTFTQAMRRVREIPFSQLVFRLSPRRLAGRDRDHLSTLWLTIAPGLAPSVLAYLHRNRVSVSAAMVEREGGRSAFGNARGGFPPEYLLARATAMPERIIDLFEDVPGVGIYRPASDNVVVELGFRHPLHLEACRSVFPRDRFYVFSGSRDAVDVITGPMQDGALALVDGERLIAVGFDLGPREPESPAHPAQPPAVRVSLRLVPSSAPPRRVTAALLSWRDAEQLKRLVFALPPTMLAGCRVAPLESGLLIVGGAGVEAVPLGEPLYEAAPLIYAPLGWEFLPRVPERVLHEYVGGVDGRLVIFKRGAPGPIGVPDGAFEALSRKVLGRIDIELEEKSDRLGAPRPTVEAQVVNDPPGAFPLWGYRAPASPEGAE